MTTAGAVSLAALHAADVTPTTAWSRRVRRIGGLIQAAFAAFWLLRGSLVIGGRPADVFIAAFSVAVIGVFAYAIRATSGTAPRPMSEEAKRIERGVTIATVVQLAASFILPAIVIAADHSDWVLPSIAITIGPLLLWLDHRVHIPRYRPVEWARWSSSVQDCTASRCMRPSPVWWRMARPPRGERRGIHSNSAPPSGTSGTKAG